MKSTSVISRCDECNIIYVKSAISIPEECSINLALKNYVITKAKGMFNTKLAMGCSHSWFFQASRVGRQQ